MKKVLAIALCLATLSAIAFSQTSKTTAQKKPLIFIETSGGNNIVATNIGYKSFSELARQMGFRIDHGKWTEINAKNLEGISVLVLATPNIFLYDKDKVALKRYIRGGGKVWYLGFGSPLPGMDFSNWSGFFKEFGVELDKGMTGKYRASVVKGSILSSPEKTITLHSPIEHMTLKVDQSKAEIQAHLDDGSPLVAITTKPALVGQGQLVISGDFTMLINVNELMFLDMADNKNFARNTLSYFLNSGGDGSFDLKALSAKVKGRPYAGAFATVVLKYSNIGSTKSPSALYHLVLTSDAVFEIVKPSDDGTLIAEGILDTLAGGKKKKLKLTVEIPPDIAPGTYYLRFVIDPGTDSGEGNRTNNIVISKKITVR